MPSAHAIRMQERARVMLWKTHAEKVALRSNNSDGVLIETDLVGVWKRVLPDDSQDIDGIGTMGYRGQAMLVVRVADMPVPPGPEAVITRNAEQWAIRHPERQDEWTWVLHLARPDAEIRMPARLR